MTELLLVCTGNAVRSVMAGFMFEHLTQDRPDRAVHVVTAGTLTVEGRPIGPRARAALLTIPALAHSDFRRHRSRQVTGSHLERADLIVAMEADHVRYVRREFPEAAGRASTIRRLCADLPPAPPALTERVVSLGLAEADLSDQEDVLDPAGGDEATYAACAAELWVLCRELAELL